MKTKIKLLLSVAIFFCFNKGSAQIQNNEDYIETLKENVEERDAFYSSLTEEERAADKSYIKYLSWRKSMQPYLEGRTLQNDWDAYEYMEANRAYRSFDLVDNSEWVELGPTEATDPSRINTRGVGPLEFLVYHPTDHDQMITGSAVGGLYYSSDRGENWANAGMDEVGRVCGVSSGTMHNNSGTWFATSSAANANTDPGYIGKGLGVFRTTDYGATYELIADYSKLGVWQKLFKIICDPVDPDVLYVCTTKGIYKFSNILAANLNNIVITKIFDINTGVAFDLEFKEGDPSILYASILEGSSWQIHYSVDAGLNWNVLPNHPNFNNANAGKDFLGHYYHHITIEMTLADPDVFYALIDNTTNSNATSELWKVSWTGSTYNWTQVSSNEHITHGDGNGFAVSQHDVDDIYTSYYITHRTNLNGLVKTTSYSHQLQYHVDIEDLMTDPDIEGVVWMASHGGLYKSSDYGVTWDDKTYGIGVATIKDMSMSKIDPGYISVGVDHNNSAYSSGNYVENNWDPQWRGMGEGDGFATAIYPLNPEYLMVSAQTKTWAMSDYGQTTFRSTGIPIGSFDLTEISFNSVNEDVSYHIKKKKVGITQMFDVSRVWNVFQQTGFLVEDISDFSTFFPGQSYIMYSFLSSDINSNYLYALVVSGGINYLFVNNNANAVDPNTVISSWTKYDLPANNTSSYRDIAVDPNDPMKVFIAKNSANGATNSAGMGSEMIFSVDLTLPFPTNYTDLTLNLPNAFVENSCIKIDKFSKQGCYLATSQGVFYINSERIFNNQGWASFGTGLPRARPKGLMIDYKANKIRIATYGRGVWEHKLSCPENEFSIETQTYSKNTYVEVYGYLNSSATVLNDKQVFYRAGDEIVLSDGFISNEGSSFKGFIHNCSSAGSGYRNNDVITPVNLGDFEEETEEENAGTKIDNVINVFPNPSDGLFRIDIGDTKVKSVTIYDVAGKKVSSLNSIANRQTLNLTSLESGVYLIEVEDKAENRYQSKIVIE